MDKLNECVAGLWAEVVNRSSTFPTIESQANYWNEFADTYEQSIAEHVRLARKCKELLRQEGLLEITNSAIEVGCGTGDLSLELASELSGITCVDISQSMLELLKQKAAKKDIQNIVIQKGDFLNHAQEYDISLSSYVPASYSREGLERLVALGKKGGLYVCGRVTDDLGLYDSIYSQLMEGRQRRGNNAIYPFILLYTMGLYPKIEYLTQCDTSVMPEDEAVQYFIRYFKNAANLPQDWENTVERCVRSKIKGIKRTLALEEQMTHCIIIWKKQQ